MKIYIHNFCGENENRMSLIIFHTYPNKRQTFEKEKKNEYFLKNV